MGPGELAGLQAGKEVGVVLESGAARYEWGSEKPGQELSHSPCHLFVPPS